MVCKNSGVLQFFVRFDQGKMCTATGSMQYVDILLRRRIQYPRGAATGTSLSLTIVEPRLTRCGSKQAGHNFVERPANALLARCVECRLVAQKCCNNVVQAKETKTPQGEEKEI